MTALPKSLSRPLTIAEYVALDEDDERRWELQEGALVMTPSPTPNHMFASGRLLIQLDPQLPPTLRAVQDVDVDLQLGPPDGPGWVRRPDLVVVRREAMDRVKRQGGLLRAEEAVLIVEILSPGSVRTDQIIKRGEYADAGIGHYWIIDLDPPASLTACHLAAGLGYQAAGEITNVLSTDEPFQVRLDLTALG